MEIAERLTSSCASRCASLELWTGCIAGALLDREYESKLRAAGFTDVGIEPTRVYDKKDAEEMAAARRRRDERVRPRAETCLIGDAR